MISSVTSIPGHQEFWSDVQSKPMSIKTKHKDRDKINPALSGQNSFLSLGEHLGKGEGLWPNPEMEQNKAGLQSHLPEREDGVQHMKTDGPC